ncbi:EpsG family protein [Myroides marinus]|uniref:EpsG family protein n=1 Tax=Myroides marinus TaxID=703342 RepID=A0A1H6XQW9_9FLAO|nr:EpsG family protein [Myroides marinus]SEJ29157.1 EpsG family protein [Myroides marinus]
MQVNSGPYLLVLFVLFFLFSIEAYFNNRRIKNRLRVFVFIFLSFFLGFRGYVGSDWFNYLISFEFTEWGEWLPTDYEPGFSLIVKGCKYIGLDYFYTVTLITLLQLILLDRFINKYFSSVVLPYIFVLSLFPIVLIDLQRNFISILIVMNSLHLLEQKKLKMYFLMVLLACFFHLSAVVFFAIPFLRQLKIKKSVLWGVFFVGLVVYISQVNFYQEFLSMLGKLLGGRLEHLMNQATGEEEISYGISFGIIEKIILCCVVIKIYDKVDKKYLLLINMCLLYLFVYFYFSTSQSFINRFANLFMFGYIWFYVFLMNYLKKQRGIGLIVILIFIFLSLRTFIGYNEEIYKYKNILFEKENYNERKGIREQHYM